ncbi:sulfite exporter TauE/SafE family protein [Microbacterium sp. NPDC096154]|uniref:sulfite exporter TauE/SafE family protein n=1 Tax=Microbacterium sp. NPDC096154 TaxID=3155549 RepID=UPI003330913D
MSAAALGFAAICLASLIGAVGQRALGMGFGLVTVPVLVLVVGPLPAVTAVNALGAVTSVIVLAQVWRLVDWRRLVWLLLPALLGVIPGILLARTADDAVLKTVVGVLILLGLALTLWLRRAERPLPGDMPVAVTGAVAGVLNGSVGVGAPILGIYGALGDWPQRAYAAALQPFFFVLSVTTVVAKGLLDPAGALPWSWWQWLLVCATLVVGVLLGHRIAAHLPERTARTIILLISLAGGVSVLWSGIAGLLA